MTSLTDTQVVTASGGLVELGHQSTNRTNVAVIATSQATATELVETTVVCDGSPILIEFECCIACVTGEGVQFGVWVDGTFNAGFIGNTNNQTGRLPFTPQLRITPSAGSHTISIRWWRWTGNSLLTSQTGLAVLRVSKIVQATQWPALTSGVIVCTSLTRPAAPTVGTFIFETDTLNLYVWDGAAWSPVSTQPTGTITSYAGSTSPSGWLLCDGAAVSRTTYASLFSALSTTYGAGNGTTTFNVPDLRGRMPIGAGNDGTAENNATRTRGVKGGDTRMPAHTHPIQRTNVAASGQSTDTSTVYKLQQGTGAGYSDTQTSGSGGGDNMPPFLVTNYIIKV